MVEEICLFPGPGQNRPLLGFFSLTFKLRIISSMVVLASHGEIAKALPVVILTTHKLLLGVDAVFGFDLLATTLAHKHMSTLLPNFVLDKL